jgi:hypothetical protein
MKKLITLALVLLSSCSSTQYFTDWKQEIKTDMDSKFGETYAVTNGELSTDQPAYKIDVVPRSSNPYLFYYYLDNYNYNMYQLNTIGATWRYNTLY